jgi:hypothetical protein
MSTSAQNPHSDHGQRMPEADDKQSNRLSGAERQARYRERLKAAGRDQADTPPCLLCGRPILLTKIDPEGPRGQSRTGRSLCAPCWRKSDEGRAAERERNRSRQRGPGG